MSKGKSLLFLVGTLLILSIAFFPGQFSQIRVSAQSGLKIFLPGIFSQPVQPSGNPPSSFTFISWADTKSGTSTLAALSNQVKKLNPVFTFYSGDLESAGFTTSGMNAWVTALNGNASNGMFNITFPLRGNHDASNGDVNGWQNYFNTSANAARIGATNFNALSNNLTYSFAYGNAYFIGIDIPGGASLITSQEIAYLDSSLKTAENLGLTHAFIFFHGPIYPVSSHNDCPSRTCATGSSVASLIKVLNQHPIVSAVFNGHEHLQSYVHMDNTRVPEITHPFEEFITGSAGAGLNPCDQTFRFDMCGSYSGFAAINVADRTFTVKVYQQGSTTPVKTYSFTKP